MSAQGEVLLHFTLMVQTRLFAARFERANFLEVSPTYHQLRVDSLQPHDFVFSYRLA
jgi:hypothetical protein